MRSAECLASRARVRIDELAQHRAGRRRLDGRWIQSFNSESKLFQLRDRGSPAAELARSQRPEVRMLATVRSGQDGLRVIPPPVMQNHDVPRGLESIPSKELGATQFVELSDCGEHSLCACQCVQRHRTPKLLEPADRTKLPSASRGMAMVWVQRLHHQRRPRLIPTRGGCRGAASTPRRQKVRRRERLRQPEPQAAIERARAFAATTARRSDTHRSRMAPRAR